MENRKLWIMGTVLVALVLVLGVLLSCAYGLYLTEQTAFRPAPAYYQTTQPTAQPVIQTNRLPRLIEKTEPDAPDRAAKPSRPAAGQAAQNGLAQCAPRVTPIPA